MAPNDQAQLSGSLNHLSEQLAATRLLLQQIEREPLPATPGIGADDGKAPSPP